jgi:hypothetical protein
MEFGPAAACYVPGSQAFDYRPYGAARLVRAGSDIALSLHYMPNGRDTIDQPMIGFTVSDTAPAKRWIAAGDHGKGTLEIPPNDPDYAAPPLEFDLAVDAELVMMMPHMHLRGKDIAYTVELPDGRRQVVLSVPHYDFQWQLQYVLAEPLRLPKGSKLHVQAHYDNSAFNRHNPNPNRWVYEGNMTWEEMLSPFVGMLVDVQTPPSAVFEE